MILFDYKNVFVVLMLFGSVLLGCTNLYEQKAVSAVSILNFQQIQTDTLFNSNQIISILSLPNNSTSEYYFDLGHHASELIPTSKFAEKENAIAAINGGFFNMDKGGSVTYLEEQDSIYQKNISHGIKWAIADWAKTGAVIIQKNGQLKIEGANTEAFYENSNAEESVLITGPMLIANQQKLKQVNTEFINHRHPRTCICQTTSSTLLITVDGRQDKAAGMSILELQDFLILKNCVTAINLDGGGSTTMWIKDKGIVNNPSDLFGERKVANVFLVKKRE